MRRGWKILIAVAVALVVLLGLNTIVTGRETKSAEVTEPGGRILHLNGGDLQVREVGPRDGSPIVLVHCFSCAMNWWDGMLPKLKRDHRIIEVDLLGHGGSEKPSSGYTIPNQADLVAQALARLRVRDATVVGHSLGGAVVVALAERSPALAARIVIIDTVSSMDDAEGLGFIAGLGFKPVVGEAGWRLKTERVVRDGLGVAFAPGFDVPDAFVEDVKRMTYSSYDDSPQGFEDYLDEESLADRVTKTGKPLLVIMGSEDETAKDPQAALDAYTEAVPEAFGNLIKGVGHSPNVEEPSLTSDFVLGFAGPPQAQRRAENRRKMQNRVQNRKGVRGQS
jgi:pimeloyl-ACP methyl ester carboxylesterase